MLRGRTRVQNACQRCRKQKIKCSGLLPCRTCRNRGLECDFGAEEKQVLISERELFELRMKAQQQDNRTWDERHWHDFREVPEESFDISQQARAASSGHVLNEALPSTSEASGNRNETTAVSENEWRGSETNPLVPGQPVYVQETSGRLRYLGHSSTYAFTQQVLQMLAQDPPSNPSPEIILSSDGVGFKAETVRLTPVVEQDISKLPSRRLALHYLQSVRFRTQPLFYLFDDADFMERLEQFYANPYEYAQANPVWYAHYLVLMAFGKALDPYEQFETSSAHLIPEHLARALRLLPDMTFLTDYPLDATELFVSLALFLQSIDHRQSAILYLGLALRMAHLYALHLNLQESMLGRGRYERCRRLWWTVYTLNQRLTSNIGLPNFLMEGDITNHPPAISADNEDEVASALHVKICRLLGLSISRVYGSGERDQQSFLAKTQAVLRGAASVAAEVQSYTEGCFGEISRVAAHLELAYHQCIIVTCRPALFGLLKMRSETLRDSPVASPSTAITGLIQVCVDSATRSVRVLDQLRESSLLDTFLPFDLDCGFSAAFVLLMASYVHPKVSAPTACIQNVKAAINAIATRGNEQAKLRSLEIQQLEQSLFERAQLPSQSTSRQSDMYNSQIMNNLPTANTQAMDFDTLFFNDFDFGNGFTGSQMMDLAEALSVGDFGLFTE